MIYPYRCPCGHDFDVIKSLADKDKDEACGKCGQVAVRYLGRPNLNAINDWTASYNPAFGCVIRSKKHQREVLAKLKGEGKEMIEIGNESPDKMHESGEKLRQEAREQRWREADEGALDVARDAVRA